MAKKTAKSRRAEAGRALAELRKTFGGGRPRKTDVPRCPCGEMTLARAVARGHKCQSSEEAILSDAAPLLIERKR